MELSRNPAYNMQLYRSSRLYDTPDIPYMEHKYIGDGRDQDLATPPYMDASSINSLTASSAELLSTKKATSNPVRPLLMCLCVGVTVCAVIAISALGIALYTLTNRVGALETANTKLSVQLKEQSEVLPCQIDLESKIHQLVANATVQTRDANTNEILQDLNATVTELRSKVSQSISPFSNCTQERTTYTLGRSGVTLANAYYFQCFPTELPMHKEVRLLCICMYGNCH